MKPMCVLLRHWTASNGTPSRIIHAQCRRLHNSEKTKYPRPRLEVRPQSSLMDGKVDIQVNGLIPHQSVTVSARLVEHKDTFLSYAHFKADSVGGLDISKGRSVGGTYTGVNQMGLFWSMEPIPTSRPGTRFMKKDVTSPSVVDISVHDKHATLEKCLENKDVMTSSSIERLYNASDVTRHEVREGRLRGTLFIPSGGGPFPAVIDLYGTGGGLFEYRASLLASHGFTTFALATFKYEDLPAYFGDTSIDYIEEAIDWLSAHPAATPGGIGTLSMSKGSEFAMMGAAVSDKIKASVNINSYPFRTLSSHRYRDSVLPAVAFDSSKLLQTDRGINMKNCNADVSSEAMISIEKSNAKFLFIHGKDDAITDADLAIKETVRLFRDKGRSNMDLAVYPGAGHLIEPPYAPVCTGSYHSLFGGVLDCGGENAPTAEAQELFWPKVIRFLRENLKNDNTHL